MLKKDVKWNWSNKYEKIIVILTSDLSLKHYDPKQDIVVASDASDTGIGAVILHKFKNRKMKAKADALKTSSVAKS